MSTFWKVPLVDKWSERRKVQKLGCIPYMSWPVQEEPMWMEFYRFLARGPFRLLSNPLLVE